jgi:hypothetical protein
MKSIVLLETEILFQMFFHEILFGFVGSKSFSFFSKLNNVGLNFFSSEWQRDLFNALHSLPK